MPVVVGGTSQFNNDVRPYVAMKENSLRNSLCTLFHSAGIQSAKDSELPFPILVGVDSLDSSSSSSSSSM